MLLSFYIKDYLKKSALTVVGATLFGIFIMYPLAENFEERIIFINWSMYIALYGLFFYNYPLTDIVKWSFNAPFTKKELIFFNIIFQIFKILLTIAILALLIICESYIIPKDMLISKFEQLSTEATSSSLIIAKSFLLEKGVSTNTVMVLFLVFTFTLSFILNVSPYEAFRNESNKESPLEFIKYYYKNYKVRIIVSFIILVIFYFLKDYYYSQAFLGGIAFFVVTSMLYITYNRVLVFPKKLDFIFLTISISLSLFTWYYFLNYSNSFLKRKDLTLAEKLSEWNFQGKEFSLKEMNLFQDYLYKNDLKSYDILKIISLANGDNIIGLNRTIKQNYEKYKVWHPFKNLSFEKTVLNKNNYDAKIMALRMFSPSKMSEEQVEMLLTNLNLNYGFDFKKSNFIIKYFKNRSFRNHRLREFLESKNPYLNHFAIYQISKSQNIELWKKMILKSKNYDNQLLFSVTQLLSRKTCTNVELSDILAIKNIQEIKINNTSCNKKLKYKLVYHNKN